MDVLREDHLSDSSNITSIESHRKFGARRLPAAAAVSGGQTASTAWYHGEAIAADKARPAVTHPEISNVIPLRH